LGRVSPTNLPVAREDGTNPPDDATDDIMDRLVKSVTRNPTDRAASPKSRKRSRLNRKSMRRTLKSGLDLDVVQALGLHATKTGDKVSAAEVRTLCWSCSEVPVKAPSALSEFPDLSLLLLELRCFRALKFLPTLRFPLVYVQRGNVSESYEAGTKGRTHHLPPGVFL
ncbi:hypothetical protein XENORESO_013404, partial [Xenotaenia resolanae]